MIAAGLAFMLTSAGSQPPVSEEPPEPEGGVLNLDIKAARQQAQRRRTTAEQCREEADVSRIAGEIVVCRKLGETSAMGFNKSDWERRYAERTQGPKPVHVDGSGLRAPDGSPMQPLVGTGFGGGKEPPLIIDIEALPEAPPGSDADRIARGLPPKGD